MKQENGTLTTLQSDMARRIVDLIRDQSIVAGSPLREVWLSEQLQVSRTPVRSALAYLAAEGVLRSEGRSYVVADLSRAGAVDVHARHLTKERSEHDRLRLLIAEGRMSGTLAKEEFESDLMRRFSIGRPLLQRVLTELAELGVVERRPGRGWIFKDAITDPQSRAESYRYRMIIEPAALMEPSYILSSDWAKRMGERHLQMVDAVWNASTVVDFYEMNAEFHEGIVSGSGNRFLIKAIQQQNILRRLSNYSIVFLPDQSRVRERLIVNTREHIAILDKLLGNEFAAAADLLRCHLERASKFRED